MNQDQRVIELTGDVTESDRLLLSPLSAAVVATAQFSEFNEFARTEIQRRIYEAFVIATNDESINICVLEPRMGSDALCQIKFEYKS